MSDKWDDPDAGGFFNPKDNIGALVLINVREYREDYEDPFTKPTKEVPEPVRDGVEVDVQVIEGEHAGEEFLTSTLHQGQLVKALKAKKTVLGVIGQGVAKGSFQPPFLLLKATEEQKSKADAFLTAQGEPPF